MKSEVEAFGTTQVSIKEFMGASDKGLILLSDINLAKENLVELNTKYSSRISELSELDSLDATQVKELVTIISDLREPRYLLQNIEKNNVSVFETCKKKDKANLKDLIDVNKDLEDKAVALKKIEDDRKQAEKDAMALKEQLRIDKIKQKIEGFETDSYKIIQESNIANVDYNKTLLDAFVNDDFDYEEYDVMFEMAKVRVQNSWDFKCNEIQEKETLRVAKEETDRKNALLEAKQELQSKRLNELLPYNAFGSDVNMALLSDLSDVQYEAILKDKKDLFDENKLAESNKQKVIQDAKVIANAKVQSDKEAIFEIRKKRFAKIGFALIDNKLFEHEKYIFTSSKEFIFNADSIEFEETINSYETEIENAKVEHELNLKKEKFELRKQVLLDLGFTYRTNREYNFQHKDWSCFHEQIYNFSDADFELYLLDIKTKIQDVLFETQKGQQAKSKERVKRFKSDKLMLQVGIEVIFVNLVLETQNDETIAFIDDANVKIQNLKTELLSELKNL